MLLSQKGNIMINLRTLISHIMIICGMILYQQAFSQIEVVAGIDNNINLSVTCVPASASASASKENFTDNNLILQHKGSKLDNSNNGACLGQLIFTFNQQEGFNVNNASFNNIPCTNSAFGVQCNVNIPEHAIGVIHFNIGIADTLAGTENNLHAEATGTMSSISPPDIPIHIKQNGNITVAQNLTVINSTRPTLLSLAIKNTGESEISNINIMEQFLPNMMVKVDLPNCTLVGNELNCSFNNLGIGQSRSIPLAIYAPNIAFVLYQAPIIVTSNIPTVRTYGYFIIAGGIIIGDRNIPSQIKQNTNFTDDVSIFSLTSNSGAYPVQWTTEYSEGLIVDNVYIDPNNKEKVTCTHTQHKVECKTLALSLGMGFKLKANVSLTAIKKGTSNASLKWEGGIAGKGLFTNNVEVN
jgi:hypothetical protein